MGLHGLFSTWWLILFATTFLAGLTGLLLSQCLNSVVAIYISIPLLLIPQILLCGLVVSFADLTPKSKTGNVPIIGDLIPSRWSFEALAVTSFTDNRYERMFFHLDKEKYETQFYNVGYLYEIQSQLETLKDEQKKGKDINPNHMQVIHTNLPIVTEYCGMKPYQGDSSYTSLYDYMKEAEKILSKRSNQATLKVDALTSDFIRKYGKETLLDLKRDNFNLKLEDFVVSGGHRRLLDVIDDVIVPRTGPVYLTPRNQMGRAPFYSSEKIIGPYHIKTLRYNMTILLLMSIIVTILLLTDYPGRYIRKNQQ